MTDNKVMLSAIWWHD